MAEDLNDRLKSALSEIDRLSKSREWYSNALEALTPLRFHGHELVNRIEQYNRYAKQMSIPVCGDHELAEFKSALAKVEKHFSG